MLNNTLKLIFKDTSASEADIIRITSELDSLLFTKPQILIAIEGRSCSGKTTFASSLANLYRNCNVFHMDDFFLPPHRKTKERLEQIGSNVDYESVRELLAQIESNKPFSYHKYDCKNNSYTKCNVEPAPINIVEGTYSMHPELVSKYDMKLYLDIDDEAQLTRLIARSTPYIYERFIAEWLPLEDKYFGRR